MRLTSYSNYTLRVLMVAAALIQTVPVSDGFRFGQMNAVIVTLCLADLARRRRADPWLPTGSLIGLAAAIKLTPAAFWVHFAVARRWKALRARDVRVREDGSGGITIRGVGGSVTVDDDGSGSIDVDAVTGDLTVRKDGKGGVHHSGVKGRVSLPD